MISKRIRVIEDPPTMSVSEREVPAHHAEITQDAVESIWGAVLSYYRMACSRR